MGLLVWLGLRRRDRFDSPTVLDQVLRSPIALLASLLYHAALVLRGAPFRPARNRPAARVVCLSDTHNQPVASVPAGDILIHAGDLSDFGSAADIQAQLDWLKSLPHPVKVLVAGNHDSFFDARSCLAQGSATAAELGLDGLLYLDGRLVTPVVKGRRIAIFGAPDVPKCGPSNFVFQYTPAMQPWLGRVPPETDILVTHTPPKHHLDLDFGCPHLLREIWRVKPRLHVFGHTHCAYSTESVYFDDLQRAYERLLSRLPRGLLGDLVPSPSWVDLAHVAFHGLHSVLWKWLMGGPGSNHGSVMVNAAQMYRNTGETCGYSHS